MKNVIQHSGHVHFFKYAKRRGHDVLVFARENEMTVDLLKTEGIEHEVLVGSCNPFSPLAAVRTLYEILPARIARQIKPDVITPIGGVASVRCSVSRALFFMTWNMRPLSNIGIFICRCHLYNGELSCGYRIQTDPVSRIS